MEKQMKPPKFQECLKALENNDVETIEAFLQSLVISSTELATLALDKATRARADRIKMAQAGSADPAESAAVDDSQPGADDSDIDGLDIPVDKYIKKIKKGVSLVTCCMNRNENLAKALPSWIKCKKLSEILIVDWSSDDPVYEYIRSRGFTDPRINVVRVDQQPRWVLSYAFNLGFRLASYDKTVKTDADIILDEAFFERNILNEGAFIAGDWRVAKKGQEHINGFFFIRRNDLMKVKGFNEYITTYGWDDDDIYNRLSESGIKRTCVDVSSIYHIPHDDMQRLGTPDSGDDSALKQLDRDPLFKGRTNRFIAHVMPAWNADRFFLPFRVTGVRNGHIKVEKSGETIHSVPKHIRDDAEYYAATELVSWRVGISAFNLPKESLRALLACKTLESISKLDIAVIANNDISEETMAQRSLVVKIEQNLPANADQGQLKRIFEALSLYSANSDRRLVVCAADRDELHRRLPEKIDFLYVPVWINIDKLKQVSLNDLIDELSKSEHAALELFLDKATVDEWDKYIRPVQFHTGKPIIVKPKLFIDVQHGLGNRLRAFASASAIAKASDRELVLVWEPDHHCECRFPDLFDYDGPVIERSFIDQADVEGLSVFNYMEIEPGAKKDGEIRLVDGVDAYMRSAYVLNSPLTSWDKENEFLRSLKPVARIQDLVRRVDVSNRIGVHVRMEAGKGMDHNTYDRVDNWTEEGHAELQYWREKSHFSKFITRIDQLLAQDKNVNIFLATDLPETYKIFEDYYGSRLAYLKRDVYDRSREQIIFSLADVLLLSLCCKLLGSTWSSFSELAMRMSKTYSSIEMSGRDF